MARPPNYKQNKQRREDAQSKRNEAKQQRKASRKTGVPEEPAGDASIPPPIPRP